MTDLEKIRTIIADPFVFGRTEGTGDGVVTLFGLPNSPVKPGSEAVTVAGAAKADPADYSLDDALGVVTFVTAPNGAVVVTYQWSCLSDDQLQTFLDLEGGIKLAAASALDTIASSEALIQKRISVLGLSVDGTAVANALRVHADRLRAQVDAGSTSDAGFDVAEMVYEPFGWIERLNKEDARSA